MLFRSAPDGFTPAPGALWRSEGHARTLEQIAATHGETFYSGALAGQIDAHARAQGGLLTGADLAGHASEWVTPIHTDLHGHRVYEIPPNGQGIAALQMLNVLDGMPLRDMGHNSAAYIHTLTETMKRAYADRSKHLGDPDFFDVPVEGLSSPAYAARIRAAIDPAQATPSEKVAPATEFPRESTQTTHFTVIDREGNVCAFAAFEDFPQVSNVCVALLIDVSACA